MCCEMNKRAFLSQSHSHSLIWTNDFHCYSRTEQNGSCCKLIERENENTASHYIIRDYVMIKMRNKIYMLKKKWATTFKRSNYSLKLVFSCSLPRVPIKISFLMRKHMNSLTVLNAKRQVNAIEQEKCADNLTRQSNTIHDSKSH